VKRVALTYHDGYDIEPYADAVRGSGLEPLMVTTSRPLASVCCSPAERT
jgi:hypothetical protein